MWLVAAVALGIGSERAEADAERARAAIDRAVAALGAAARTEARGWSVEGRGRENLSAELQGEAPGAATWRAHEERIAVDPRTLATAWERKTPRVDRSLRWRRFIWRADSSGFFDWNAGRGRLRAAATPEAARRALARRVPHLLLAEAAMPTTRLVWAGEARVQGRPHDLIEAVFEDGARLELAIGREVPALARASSRVVLPAAGEVRVDWEWTGWRADAALGMKPAGHHVDIDGVRFQEVRYAAYGVDEIATAGMLALPPNRAATAGASHTAPTHANAATPRPPATGEVAPGVRVIEVGNFTVMWVEFADFVVAMEAPEHHPGWG
jgi:hypothetical protein